MLLYLSEDAEDDREKREDVRPRRGEIHVTSGSVLGINDDPLGCCHVDVAVMPDLISEDIDFNSSGILESLGVIEVPLAPAWRDRSLS